MNSLDKMIGTRPLHPGQVRGPPGGARRAQPRLVRQGRSGRPGPRRPPHPRRLSRSRGPRGRHGHGDRLQQQAGGLTRTSWTTWSLDRMPLTLERWCMRRNGSSWINSSPADQRLAGGQVTLQGPAAAPGHQHRRSTATAWASCYTRATSVRIAGGPGPRRLGAAPGRADQEARLSLQARGAGAGPGRRQADVGGRRRAVHRLRGGHLRGHPGLREELLASVPEQAEGSLDFELKGRLDATGYTEIAQGVLQKRLVFIFGYDNG